MTVTESNVALLAKLGWREVASRSGKYRTFVHDWINWKVFVGRRGALRRGDYATASVPVTQDFLRILVYRAGA